MSFRLLLGVGSGLAAETLLERGLGPYRKRNISESITIPLAELNRSCERWRN
jgi:hypothetical protein